MKKTTEERIHMVSILMAVGAGLILASVASAASVHAQANNTSSSGVVTNMTSAAPSAAANITRVIVTLEVKEGEKQEALKTLIPLAELARNRQGNIAYDIYSSTENPNELILDQLWSSKIAFDKHYNSQEASKFRETVTPLLVKAAEVKTYIEEGKMQP